MTLTLPLPPSLNHYWRRVGARTLVSAEGRAYRERCHLVALAQRARPLDGEVAVRAVVYMARLGCDLDNRAKVLLDALSGAAWHDDAQVADLHLIRRLDRDDPRVEVEILPALAG